MKSLPSLLLIFFHYIYIFGEYHSQGCRPLWILITTSCSITQSNLRVLLVLPCAALGWCVTRGDTSLPFALLLSRRSPPLPLKSPPRAFCCTTPHCRVGWNIKKIRDVSSSERCDCCRLITGVGGSAHQMRDVVTALVPIVCLLLGICHRTYCLLTFFDKNFSCD